MKNTSHRPHFAVPASSSVAAASSSVGPTFVGTPAAAALHR